MNTIEQIFGPTTNNLASRPSNELGQEDFLKLMVAQLKNQDPSNPMDNAEFLGQIAQFSMVSGIDDLGVAFEGVSSNLFTAQAMQAAQLVGKDVLTETATATLAAGGIVEGVFATDQAVSNTRLNIYDATGSLVNRFDLGTIREGSQRFIWDGLRQDGSAAAPGEYVIAAEGLINGDLSAVQLKYFNRVESVSVNRATGGVLLNLSNGDNVSFSQISEYK